MNFLKPPRAWSFALYLGLSLTVGMSIVPIPVRAADSQPIIGVWEGTLDPGAQPKKRIVVHISAAQDGSLNGTIDYPDQDISGTAITALKMLVISPSRLSDNTHERSKKGFTAAEVTT